MSVNLKDMTDPQLQDRAEHLNQKLAAAEKGSSPAGNARDTDAGVALSVAMSAATGGLSPVIEAIVTALDESRNTTNKSAFTPTGAGGKKTRMPGERPVSRFTDIKPVTGAVAAAPKTQGINLMSPVAATSKFTALPAGVKSTILLKPAGKGPEPLKKEDVAKAKLPAASAAAIKVDAKKMQKPAIDKLKIKLGEVKKEQETPSTLPLDVDDDVGKRLEHQLKVGSPLAIQRIQQAPQPVQQQLAKKMMFKPPTPGM